MDYRGSDMGVKKDLLCLHKLMWYDIYVESLTYGQILLERNDFDYMV